MNNEPPTSKFEVQEFNGVEIMRIADRPWNITFRHIACGTAGKLFINDEGMLDFEGDVTESAKIFVEHVIKSSKI